MGQKNKTLSIDGSNPDQGSSSNPAAASAFAQLSFAEVLEDLSSRFIVNLPAEELASIERICFQVEQAHWFYEDFLRPLNPSLASFSLRRFSSYLLHTSSLTVPLIQRYISTSSGGKNQEGLEAAFDEFLKYKTRVPVCGVVMLNSGWDKCVLVKGWKSSAAWGFPKGKINQQESERDCAVREVLEETGYDCDALLDAESSDFMELTMREQKIRLYIVPGVDESTHFETLTRKEISRIAWFKLSDLPTWKKNRAPPQGMGGKFYLISPFIGKLKQWIQENKHRHKGTFAASEEYGAHAMAGNTEEEREVRSGDLKMLLGLSGETSGVQLAGKGRQMIEDQGDARGRQLLDLLRGTSSGSGGSDERRETSSSPRPPVLDERERGTATLLAALNAGAGKATEMQGTTNGSSNSAALLSMLNSGPMSQQRQPPTQTGEPFDPSLQPATGRHYARLSSPLPAPQAQNTSQSQSLLNLISPAMGAPVSSIEPVQDGGKDWERARQRDALLSGLMASSLSVHHPSVDQVQERPNEFRFPPATPATLAPPPPLPPSLPPSNMQRQDDLLALLHGNRYSVQPPPPAASPFSTYVQQSQQASVPQQHQGHNPLLALLNNTGDGNLPQPAQEAHHSPYPPPPPLFQMHHQASSPVPHYLSFPPPPPPPPPHLYSPYPQGAPVYQQHQQHQPHHHPMGHPPPPPLPPAPYGYLSPDHRPQQSNSAMDALAKLLPS